MNKIIQDKINAIEKLAQKSKGHASSNNKKDAVNTEDSLSRLITNKKEADIFMAELNAASRAAQGK